MGALNNAAAVVGVLSGVFLLGGLMLPGKFAVERVGTIDAPVDVVFELVNDLKKNESWSVWKQRDPTMTMTLGEITIGEGASFAWSSEASGDGVYKIVRVEPNRRVVVRMSSPEMGDDAEVAYVLTNTDGKTRITWTFKGRDDTPVLGPYIALTMDGALGPMLEEGIRKMDEVARKAVADRAAKAAARASAEAAAKAAAEAAARQAAPAAAAAPAAPAAAAAPATPVMTSP